ncbi:oxidoreductase [Yinghuangia soli]|uniref:Oxidoreductase n=1 Tax=Yinghuangia soli TaxID=2908204 RepID=A0AA41Q4Q1_9ACTN|nr:oxidoreductase [Yinghuangia soli]MCF2530394.1 oxidoreductase [Yinghuangia soli]
MADLPDDLTPAEVRVWEAYRNGTQCAFGAVAGPQASDWPTPRGRFGADWGPERTVRAEVLSRLLLGAAESVPGRMPALDLVGARITGNLHLRGARVDAYVALRGCHFDGRVTLNDATTSTIRLMGCSVEAVRGRRARVDGDLCLTNCRIRHGINLVDAQVATDLVLHGSRIFPMDDGRSINADGLELNRDLSAHGPFHATGTVSLRSARIGGRVTFFRARIDARPGLDSRGFRHLALDGASMYVEQTLHLSDHFAATGSIRLNDARFGDAIVIDQAEILRDPDEALAMWRVTARTLSLVIAPDPQGRILMSGSQFGALTDTPDTWPDAGRIAIGGMTYTVLRSTRPMTLDQRLTWLAHATPEYEPQPYEQLATAYRASGQDEEARSVLLAKQRRNRETLRPAGRIWGHIQDAAIGYGYRPARALSWLVALIAIGTVAFSIDRPTPIKADEAPHWNAFFYTVDLLLPVVTFGQEAAWNPGGWAQWVAYTLIILGWILAGAAAAGATRVLNRA